MVVRKLLRLLHRAAAHDVDSLDLAGNELQRADAEMMWAGSVEAYYRPWSAPAENRAVG